MKCERVSGREEGEGEKKDEQVRGVRREGESLVLFPTIPSPQQKAHTQTCMWKHTCAHIVCPS